MNGRMNIGRLIHSLILQRIVTVTDPLGGHTEGPPETVADVKACIEGMSGVERVSADGQVAEVSHRVTIHYRSDVLAEWRLYDEEAEQIYEIVRVYDPDGTRIWTEMETVMVPRGPD